MTKYLLFFLQFALGGIYYSQSFVIDTSFYGSKIYSLDYPEKLTTLKNGDVYVGGSLDFNNIYACHRFESNSFHFDSNFHLDWALTNPMNLFSIGDTLMVRDVIFFGFDSLGNEIMPEFRQNQNEEFFVNQNINSASPYYNKRSKELYGFCSAMNQMPCVAPYENFYQYKLKVDGTLDTTFRHNINNGVSSITEFNENKLLITGGFTEYDGNSCSGIGFIDMDGNWLNSDFEVKKKHAQEAIFTMVSDSLKRTLLLGRIQVGNDTLNSYYFVRIDSLGHVDSTFHFWNFPFDFLTGIGSIVEFKDWYIIGGTFESFYGHNYTGIAAITKNGEIDTLLFKNGFTLASDPSLGIPPSAYSITISGNTLFTVGNFLEYNNLPAIKMAKFDYIEKETITEPEQINIYPNPFFNTINLSGLTENEIVQIFDLNGRKVYEFNYTSQNKNIDLSFLQKSIYFIKTEKALIQKILKL